MLEIYITIMTHCIIDYVIHCVLYHVSFDLSVSCVWFFVLIIDYELYWLLVRYFAINNNIHSNKIGNSLAAARWSCAPGRARMPVHQAGTVSRAIKAPGAGLGTRRRTDLSSQQVVWAPEVPPRPLLFHEERPWICTPANARYPITAGWTGGRQRKKNQMEKSLSRGLEPRTQPLPRLAS